MLCGRQGTAAGKGWAADGSSICGRGVVSRGWAKGMGGRRRAAVASCNGRQVADGQQWVGCRCVESCAAAGSSKVQVGGDALQQAVEAVGSGAA